MNAANDYNRLASVYDLLAGVLFLGSIDRAQIKQLHHLPENAKIVWLGGGTGRVLNRVIELSNPDELWYIDKSEAMIRKAKQTCRKEYHPRIKFICGTQDDLPQGLKFDAAITFFFFDQFERMELMRIFLRIHSALKPVATWLWADFVQPTKSWQHGLMNAMFLFFRITTGLRTKEVFDLPKIFLNKGYRIQDSSSFYGEFISSMAFIHEGELQ